MRIKEVKAARKKKQLLLLAIKLLQIIAFCMVIATGYKAFLLSIADPGSTVSIIGCVLALAAMGTVIMLQHLFDEVKRISSVGRRTEI